MIKYIALLLLVTARIVYHPSSPAPSLKPFDIPGADKNKTTKVAGTYSPQSSEPARQQATIPANQLQNLLNRRLAVSGI